MTDRAGFGTSPQPDLSGEILRVDTLVVGRRGNVAVEVGDSEPSATGKSCAPVVVRTEGSVGRDALGQVKLAPHDAKQILALAEVPGLTRIRIGLGRPRKGNARREAKIWQGAADVLVLIAKISRQPHPVAAIVEAEQRQRPC